MTETSPSHNYVANLNPHVIASHVLPHRQCHTNHIVRAIREMTAYLKEVAQFTAKPRLIHAQLDCVYGTSHKHLLT